MNSSSVFVDCSTLKNCSACLSEWSCVWCGRHNRTDTNTTTSVTTVPGHCAPGQFWGPESRAVEQCPSYEYRLCGLDGRITVAAAALVVLVFLSVLAALCWCCWCRVRRNSGQRSSDIIAAQQQQQRRARFSTLSPGALHKAPASAEMRRKLLVDVSDDDDSDLAFHSTPTPIADQRRKEMTLKWGVASDASNQHHQATYSSAPSRTPPADAVYFSSIN